MKVFTILTLFLIITISFGYKGLLSRDKYTLRVRVFPRCTEEDYDDERMEKGLCEKVTMMLRFKDFEIKGFRYKNETKTCGNTIIITSGDILLTEEEIDGTVVGVFYSNHTEFNIEKTLFLKDCKGEFHRLDMTYTCNLGKIGPISKYSF